MSLISSTFGNHGGRPMWTNVTEAGLIFEEWVDFGGSPATSRTPVPWAYDDWVDLIAETTEDGPFFMSPENAKLFSSAGWPCVKGDIYYGGPPPLTAGRLRYYINHAKDEWPLSFGRYFQLRAHQFYLYKLGGYAEKKKRASKGGV